MRTLLWIFPAILCAIPTFANSPEPSDKDITRAAQTCTADGAFGVRFGDKVSENEKSAGIAPFGPVTVRAHEDGIYEIWASASFAKAPMSQEDRFALTGWFLRKLDSEITATRKFTHREPLSDGVVFLFQSAGSEGFLLNIHQIGTSVFLTCSDIARKTRR